MWSGSYWEGGCRKVNSSILQSALGRGHSRVVGSSRRHTFCYCLLQVSYFKQGQQTPSSRPRHQPPLPSVPTTAFPPGSPLLHRIQVIAVECGASRARAYCSPGLVSQARAIHFSEPWVCNSCYSLAGYYAGVGLGWVKEHPGNYSSCIFSSPHLYCSFLNSQVIGIF